MIVLALVSLVAVWGAVPSANGAQSTVQAPDSLTDAEFWKFFTTMSEPDGYFLSENFVSNEVSFQELIPTLQKSLTRNGVYLGVGPEQNFTYVANLAPRMAVIFDIRRQNAMQHLMYKALFEMSPTRADFVSMLFSRPSVAGLDPAIAVSALFDSAMAALPSDSAYQANRAAIVQRLTGKRGFALSKDDIASIEHVYSVFFAAGPDVNYGYRFGSGARLRSTYPNFAMLQSATNADSVQMAFLATEANYQAVRRLQLRNLVVPVVGDFGGPSAIRSVGTWLRERQMTVTAFYVSNVEQYLFRSPGASDRFYINVSSLPFDTTSHFIRSVPRMGSPSSMSFSPSASFGTGAVGAGGMRFVITRDASGTTTTQTFRDSAGMTLVQTTVDSGQRDSTTLRAQATRDSVFQRALREMTANDTTLMRALRALSARRDSIARGLGQWQPFNGGATNGATNGPANGPTTIMMGGLLTSGIAPIKSTLDSFFLGDLTTYNAVVGMTKTTGWR